MLIFGTIWSGREIRTDAAIEKQFLYLFYFILIIAFYLQV